MALTASAGKFVGKTVQVKLNIDMSVRGVPLKRGDTIELPVAEAQLLVGYKRAVIVASPATATAQPAAGSTETASAGTAAKTQTR